ncbi:arylsulfatase [Zobellia amurskyensis]|uniref:Arylsulfatase n=1 Tax=Zobellia amurskyensis TaxID=248905 RepID=A0A7X3D1G5_9FLAO|nr:arylsulfatase [Zobellia amurskyensis]MUH35523.1 arylsulfatase [Zobellia amurskyensis]
MILHKVLILSLLLFSILSMEAQDERPNIVLIMADDLGYSDIGCYGGEIETPNIDSLANEGIRFTQFMNATKCAASRASLLTGLYPIESGSNGEPTQMINSITVAELLKKAGYRTLMTGKWHAKETPPKRGFDRFFGSINGSFDYFKPKPHQIYMIDKEKVSSYIPENPNDFYTTDAFTDKAIDYLNEYKHEGKPFFLYVAYNAPHFPLQAWPKDIEKYRGKYSKGWDEIRKERFNRQIKMGLVKLDWKLSQRDEEVPSWDDFTRKDDADLTMATYAGMVDRMDQNIGKILKKLDDLGIADNTLVLFLSDNGACAEGEMWDGENPINKPGARSSQAKLGVEWANASNTPYRKFKRYMYNGGQLTPLIARWPKGIESKGDITFELGHLVDIMPTIAELAKIEYPAGSSWEVVPEKNLLTNWDIQPLSGKSLLPIFNGQKAVKRDYFLGYFQGARMIIRDSLKLVSDGSDGTIQHLYDYPWELYNLNNDATEINNLAWQFPDLIDSLDLVYRQWIDQTHELTGIKNHIWFQHRLTKEQQIAANELEKDPQMQKLLAERREIGLSIVNQLNLLNIKMKRGLGMKKVPMSYFGLVEEGRQFTEKDEELKKQYLLWDQNIARSEKYCKNKGQVFAKVWEVQERTRPHVPASEVY